MNVQDVRRDVGSNNIAHNMWRLAARGDMIGGASSRGTKALYHMIIETTFTPFQSLFGGALIGVASVLLMATMGRIMGATGVLAGFIDPQSKSDWSWRALVLLGMVSGPLVVFAVSGQMPAVDVPVSRTMLIIGGLIVGVGVTYGGGCTSGHGVCGIARLSPRSIVATATFMAATTITVFVIRHVIGG